MFQTTNQYILYIHTHSAPIYLCHLVLDASIPMVISMVIQHFWIGGRSPDHPQESPGNGILIKMGTWYEVTPKSEVRLIDFIRITRW